jgi:hypothetical protein
LLEPLLFLAESRKDQSGLYHVFRRILPQRDEKLALRLAGKTRPHLRQFPEYPLPRLEIPADADGAVQDRVGRRPPGDEVPAFRHVGEHDVDEGRRDASRVAVNTGDLFGELSPGGFVEQSFGTDALVNWHEFPMLR